MTDEPRAPGCRCDSPHCPTRHGITTHPAPREAAERDDLPEGWRQMRNDLDCVRAYLTALPAMAKKIRADGLQEGRREGRRQLLRDLMHVHYDGRAAYVARLARLADEDCGCGLGQPQCDYQHKVVKEPQADE